MPDSDNESGGPSNAGEYASAREQDRFLPIANVSRIMKRALPANAKISKDAKETVQECVSEFISFITGEASDKCQREKRKTINGDDLLWAMTTLGFEDYIDPLKLYLHKFRELEGEKAIGAAGSGGGGAASSGGAGSGSGSHHHQDASRNNGGYGMYGGGGGMIMMMGQPMYGSPPASSAGYAQPPPPHHHHHQMVIGGKGAYGHGGGGGGGPSPSSGYGRQDRL